MYETESEDNMTNIKRKVLSVAIILLGILIISPTLYAQSPNNNRGRQQRQRTIQQNTHRRQRPVIRARQTARQNWWLRLINIIQRRNAWKFRTQLHQNRIEQRREYSRHFTRNHHNRNNNYNNNHWGRR